MNPPLRKRVLLFLVATVALQGCHRNQDWVKETTAIINRALKPGDPVSKVEAFLNAHGYPINYNPFDNRYESGDPRSKHYTAPGVEAVVTFNINLNADKTFKSAEVRMTYTSL